MQGMHNKKKNINFFVDSFGLKQCAQMKWGKREHDDEKNGDLERRRDY